jgi:hypothetical protein
MNKITEVLENLDFIVHNDEEDSSIEIECWTEAGVNMFIIPKEFTEESIIKEINEFDIDEQVHLHFEMKSYKKDFTIKRSLEDFEKFKNRLLELKNKLEDILV